ncbi:ornithine cyclodeaminase family protein [Thermanaerosceptrum fracticalcis]|nr:ornithine cyclodeaminase family protein [Thermanaerosceptrum fracticalcis]
MTEVIVLTDQDVENLVTFEETMEVVEKAFADWTLSKSHIFPVVREEIKKHQGIFGIKSGYLEEQEALGFKAGGFWVNNKDKGLTNHQSTMVLFDPATGQPQALVAANFVTKIRTAALGALGLKYLARPDSRVLAVIGAGLQGRNQLEAALKILPGVREIYLYDIYHAGALKLAQDLSHYPQEIKVVTHPEEACRAANVIITAASSYQAIVMAPWIKPGTHINAIGTDTRGKQELDPQIFAMAKVVVDSMDQCLYLGECQHAYDQGIISRDSIHGEIGELITGRKPGRENPLEITIFDTTGVALQDLATAGLAVNRAKEKGVGVRVNFLGK